MTHSTQETGQDAIKVSGAVAAALAAGRPVVALESTIFSNLGLPAPANGDALPRCLAAVRAGGADPAVTAILDGEARVGLDEAKKNGCSRAAGRSPSATLPSPSRRASRPA